MWPSLRVLVVFLCGQATFGQVQVRVRSLYNVHLTQDSTDAASQVAVGGHPAGGHPDLGFSVGHGDDQRRLPSAGVLVHPPDRYLQQNNQPRIIVTVDLELVGCEDKIVTTDVTLVFREAGVNGNPGRIIYTTIVRNVKFENGKATVTIPIDAGILPLKEAKKIATTDLEGTTNAVCPDGKFTPLTPKVEGDPHMVGLLGQKIDWAGEDNTWYCLLSDGPEFQINLRLSAPMKEEFPDRQLVSAVSLLTGDGHSLVIEVKDPYSTETDGCPEEWSVPCLAEGGVRILVDGEVSTAVQSPGHGVHLPGGVVVSAANLMPECRPFGGDRIWAALFEKITTGRRSLRANSPVPSFSEWVLESDTLAAPTWCAKRLEEDGPAGLFSTSSNHMTVRIETEVANIRVNVGVNYQDLETGPDGTVLIPELEFWQTELGFDGLHYSGTVAGLLGDTARFVLDDEGLPVTTGLEALHAPVESYRVDGPFGRVFDNMLQ